MGVILIRDHDDRDEGNRIFGSIGYLFWKTESHYNEESCQAFCGY